MLRLIAPGAGAAAGTARADMRRCPGRARNVLDSPAY